MAGHAGGVGDVVVAVEVALRARSFGMHPGQRETGLGVIKNCVGPRRRAVAGFTGRRKACLQVIGVGGVVVILHVACGTGATGQVVVAVNVTLSAGQVRVRSGEGETRECMIEARVSPRSSIVANLAGLGYSGLYVIWIRGALVVLHVTGHARSIFQVVVPVDMALGTGCRHMFAGEREAGGGVIEGGVCP